MDIYSKLINSLMDKNIKTKDIVYHMLNLERFLDIYDYTLKDYDIDILKDYDMDNNINLLDIDLFVTNVNNVSINNFRYRFDIETNCFMFTNMC